MATRLGANLVHRAHALGLFVGDPIHYYPAPDGKADDGELDHLINTIVREGIARLEAAKK